MIRSRAQYDAMTFDEVVADIKESLEDKTGLGIALTRSMARTLLAGLARPEATPVRRNAHTCPACQYPHDPDWDNGEPPDEDDILRDMAHDG
jgi:hypothetical protein